jgi:type III secretory pathway component EscS
MNEHNGLLSNGLAMVARNKRYVIWFWVLNLILGGFGVAAFSGSVHAMLDHSLAAASLLPRFDLGTFMEMFAQPEFGQAPAMDAPAVLSAILFFLATALFLPGVLAGYASRSRLPRDDFFRACGRNLWRFIRLLIISGLIIAIVAGLLFFLQHLLVKRATESTNELLPFQVRMLSLTVIFLIMTTLRIWFDLAEVDTVLNDQRAVRKSLRAAFRHTFRNLPRLLSTYVLAAIVAGIFLVAGLWIWVKFVPPSRVLGAFLAGQITLFLLLIPRFWQRGMAVTYCQQRMIAPLPAFAPVSADPAVPEPAIPGTPPLTPPQPQES